MDAGKLLELRDNLKNARQNFDTLYDEVEDYVYPRRKAPKYGETQGEKESRKVYDSTPTIASELLASSLNSTLANPAGNWFDLDIEDESAVNVKQFRDILFDNIVKEKTGFQTNFYETVLESVVYGGGCIFVGWNDKEDCLLFQNVHCRKVYIDEDASGQINTVIREIDMTATQIEQMFGFDNCPANIQNMITVGNISSEKKRVVQFIIPNEKHTRRSAEDVFKYKSVYVLEESKHILAVGGFDELPLIYGRWTKQSGETYGRSPVIYMLPDIKMLNFFMKEMIIGAQLQNRPPLLVQDDEQIKLPQIVPNGIITYSGVAPQPLQTGANVSANFQIIEEIRNRIRKGMYNDLLMFSDQPVNMTATEYMKRTEENVKLLSPMVGRLQAEILTPLLKRCFSLLASHHKFDDIGQIPPRVAISYTTISDVAFKMNKITNLVRLLETSAGYLQLDPQSAGVIDSDKVIREIGENLGVADVLKDEEEVAQSRLQANAEAEAMKTKEDEAQLLQMQNMSLQNKQLERM